MNDHERIWKDMKGGGGILQYCHVLPTIQDLRQTIHRKKHKRVSKREAPDETEKKAIAVSKYFWSIGLTWPTFQKMHKRRDLHGFTVRQCKTSYSSGLSDLHVEPKHCLSSLFI